MTAPADTTPALAVTGLSKRFGASVALQDVELAIGHGEVQWRPAFRVFLIRIGSIGEQKLCDVIVTILNRHKQRTAAVDGCLVFG